MHVTQISGHHIHITPAIKEHINEKLTKIVQLTDQIRSDHLDQCHPIKRQ